MAATVASFAYGLLLTGTNPPAAYFASPARMWELSVGGVLALVHRSEEHTSELQSH